MARTNPAFHHPLQRKIARQITPLMVGLLILFGLFVIILVITGTLASAQSSHTRLLEDTSRILRIDMDGYTDVVSQLVSNSSLNALRADDLENPILEDTAADFARLIALHPTEYLSIRTFTPGGIQQIEVLNKQGTPQITPIGTLSRMPNNVVEQAGFQQALESNGSQVIISDFVVESTSADQITFNLYVPIFHETNPSDVVSVVEFHVSAERLLRSINNPPPEMRSIVPDARFILLDNRQFPLADSQRENVSDLNNLGGTTEADQTLALYNELGLYTSQNPEDYTIRFNGNHVISAQAIPVGTESTIQWDLLIVDNASAIYAPILQNVLIIIVAIALLSAGLILFLNRRLLSLLQPVTTADRLLQELATGESAPTQLTPSDSQESSLISAIKQVTQQLHKLEGELEQASEHRSRDLQIVAQIGRETATLNDIQELLQQAIELICTRLGFYHAQVFLVDDVHMNAILAYSRGEAGQKLLEAGHKLAIGSDSIIGRVTDQQTPVIVNDISEANTLYRPNLYLPMTRAEIGLPLSIGNNAIGALDIQSLHPNAFDRNDIPVFQLLADQLAIAIYNASLAQESEQRIQQIDRLNRQLTQSSWQDAEENYELEKSFVYDLRDVQEQANMDISALPGVAAPIRIRGEVIGTLNAAPPEGQSFAEGDQIVLHAVAERVALAIENARLLQETQNTLSETSVLYELSRQLSEANSFQEIINVIIETAIPDARQGQVWLFPDTSSKSQPVLASAQITSSNTAMPTQLIFAEHPLLQSLSATEVLAVPDLGTYTPADKKFQQFYRQDSIQALLFIPLNMRGEWKGFITIEFEQPRRFIDRELRLYTALIDQAGIVLDNQLLLRQTEQALNETRRLYFASREIANAQNLQSIYQSAADYLARPFLQGSNQNQSITITLLLAHPEASAQAPELEYSFQWSSSAKITFRTAQGTIIDHQEAPFASLLHKAKGAVLYRNLKDHPDEHPGILSILGENNTNSAIVAPLQSRQFWFGALICGSDQANTFNQEYTNFVQAIADQIALSIENQRLLQDAESERQNLQGILSTLPAGVLVLDPHTYVPIRYNEGAEELLGQSISMDTPFTASGYKLYRTGTNIFYPDGELPIYHAVEHRGQSFSDDVAILREDQQIDLLVNATPIFDEQDNPLAIVATFQDISNLRGLENTLQENLRETVALYEAQRAFSEADTLDELLDAIHIQLVILEPTDAYILLTDEHEGSIQLARHLIQPIESLFALAPLMPMDSILNIPDVHQHPDLADTARTVFDEMGLRSAMIIPLRVRTRLMPLGWLMVVDTETDGFSADQTRALTALSDMAQTALDNRYLFQSTQRSLQETGAIYSATTGISRATDLDELIQAIDTALAGMNSDMYAGYLIQGQDHPMELFKHGFEDSEAAGLDTEKLAQMQLPESQGIFINDITRATMGEFELEIVKAENIRAFAAVSLRVKDAPSGCLFLGFRDEHDFAEGEVRFLNAIADSASVIIDNQFLLDQVQDALQETSTLYQASRALTDVSTPAEILDVVVNHLIGPHINQVFIALLNSSDWNTPGATVKVETGWQPTSSVNLEGIVLTADLFPAWKYLSSQTVVVFNDIYAEEYDLDDLERTSIESLDTRSLIIIPLRVAARSIGSIWISSKEAYQYTDTNQRIFQAFAEQASLSLEAAYLLTQTEHRATQLETSAAVGQSVGQILDLDVLLPQVVTLIQAQFEYDHVQVFLMDDEDEYAVLHASTGTAGELLLANEHKLRKGSNSVIGQVVTTAEPTIALDTADAEVVHRPNPFLPLTRSEMALPLVVKGKVVGALDVQSNEPNAFDNEDIRALTTLSAQISVAIDNARLYEQTQNRAEDMSFLFELTTAAAAADTMEGALEGIAERIQESLQALSCAIYLPKRYMDAQAHTFTTMSAVVNTGTDQPLSEIAEVRIDDSENLIGIVSSTLQPQLVPDIQTEVRYLPIEHAARSAMIIPIGSGSKVIGLITVESVRLNAYDHDTLQLMIALSGSLAAIIQNVQLLDQLQETNEQLREVDRLKSQFLANMSHELRTPLNSIIGFSRVMLKGIDGPLTEMQEQDLTTIFGSGQHLLNLINDILDQAKIEAGELDLKFAYFEVKPMIESVRSIAIGLIKEKPISLNVDISSGMPQAYGDEFRSRQILLNLVTNAAKFTPEGSIAINAYLTETDNNRMIRVDVVDTGIGIDDADLPILFEQFRQIDSSLTRTVGGTGLGLPISKSLAELQGGELTVESEVGAGSVFSVTIPIEPNVEDQETTADEEKDKTPTPINPTLDTSKSAGKHKDKKRVTQPVKLITKREILLIEDNKDMVDQYRRLLQREGFDVQTADSAVYAEAMASNLRPNAIVMDVNFADGAGWDILQRLKESDYSFDIPVIVATMADDSERAFQLGANYFIQRPFSPEQLLEAALQAEKESNRERILIIDDQPESIRLLEQVLAEQGSYRVFSAEGGNEGIALVARRHPDLIILDLRMPELDGFAVLEELQANPETAAIPVLILTGDDNLTQEEQALLEHIPIRYKTEISEQASDQFLQDIQLNLSGDNGNGTE